MWCYLDLVGVNHIVIGGVVQSVVEITQEEIVVAEDVRIHLLALSFQGFEDLFSHVVPLNTVILPMQEMYPNEIEVLVIVVEEHLDTAFVTNSLEHPAWLLCCRYLPVEEGEFGVLGVGDTEYLPHRHAVNLLEIMALHVLVQAVEEVLTLVRLLEDQDDEIVFFGLWKQHIQIWCLLLPRHIPSKGENLHILLACDLLQDPSTLKMNQSIKILIELVHELSGSYLHLQFFL